MRSPTLSTLTAMFVLASMFIGLSMAYLVLNERVATFQEGALRLAVQTRLAGLQTAFSQALYREWNNLGPLAERLKSKDPKDLQDELTALVGSGEVISWAGYASSDGIVAVASNGLLVGQSVKARPWFQRGLEGDFAGDAHEAVLLASKLPASPTGEPLRFLDFATPIKDAYGKTTGVLGVHLNLDWAKETIVGIAKALEIDVFVVSPNGTVVISSVQGDFNNLDLASFRRARAGALGAGVERWPDSKTYFSATLTELTYSDLPKFGWGIIGRIGADAAIQPAKTFSTGLIANLVTFGALLLLLTLVFVVIFVRPFNRLAENARAIAAGEDVYPFESDRTRELSIVSAALAKLQCQVGSGSDKK
ncbi:cache domain-containing protein [Pararhizobium arenae]|uniref:cache domain-containing protein n=1 Tax=Pararhizobium arenae TaxID=1856850 RepID=UPI00094B0E95|nr:cache domain-containing protein [Pararhizobium arenae]